MATQEAWTDRYTMISLFQNLKGCIDNFIIYAKELNKFKNDVMDDPDSLAEMKKLIDEDPRWSIQDIQTKYQEFKTIYEYLKEE